MRFQRLTNYLLTHRTLASVLTLFITSLYAIPGGSLVCNIGMIFAALVTLVRGPREGAIFTAIATLPYLVITFFLGSPLDLLPTGTTSNMAGIFIVTNILTYAFAVMLYKRASWSQLIQVAALFGVFAISVIHLVYPGIIDWWTQYFVGVFARVQQQLTQHGLDKTVVSPANINEAASRVAMIATGVSTLWLLVLTMFQLIIARWWQASVYSPGSLGPELRNIRLSQLAGIFFLASMVMLRYDNTVVLDIIPVLFFMFVAAGLSLMHYAFFLMPRTPTTTFCLVLAYAVMIYVLIIQSFVVFVLLSIFALFDVWLDVRKRLKKV